jgi:hypothetical protein
VVDASTMVNRRIDTYPKTKLIKLLISSALPIQGVAGSRLSSAGSVEYGIEETKPCLENGGVGYRPPILVQSTQSAREDPCIPVPREGDETAARVSGGFSAAPPRLPS